MGRDSTPPDGGAAFKCVTHSGGARRSQDSTASPGEGAEQSSLGTETQTPGRAGTREQAWHLCRVPEKATASSSLHPPDTSPPPADSDETRGNGFKRRGKV